MIFRFENAHGDTFITSLVILLFAAAFLVIGFMRVVEFQDKRFSPIKELSLTVTHLIGVVAGSLAMALFAIDVDATHTKQIGTIVAVAFIVLVPLHIYLGLVRRVRLKVN